MKWFLVWMSLGYALNGIVGPFDSREDCMEAMTTMVSEAYDSTPPIRFKHFYCSQLHELKAGE